MLSWRRRRFFTLPDGNVSVKEIFDKLDWKKQNDVSLPQPANELKTNL